MGTGDGKAAFPDHHHSDTEVAGSERVIPYSGPLSGPLNKRVGRKSARFKIPSDSTSSPSSSSYNNQEPCVEITLDVSDDSVAVDSVKAANGADIHEDPELALHARGLEKRSASFGSSVVRSDSSRIRQVSQEHKRLTSFSKKPPARLDRTKSAAAYALEGLKFISKTDGGVGWAAVEKRFDEISASTDGVLPRARFGECIGMNNESKEFAVELFDALTRRRNIEGDSITKDQLREFWDQISNQSFDSRLQTFFDMVDKDADGRITEEEVREIISLSASANKLTNIQNQAEEYAALIMEELDPDHLGYIMIDSLEMLLLQAPSESVKGEESRNQSKMTQFDNVEITLDIHDPDDDDYVAGLDLLARVLKNKSAVHSVKAVNDADIQEDPELSVIARGLQEERFAPSGSSLVRSVSARIRNVSQELKLLTSFSKKPPARFDETKYAAAHALGGLEFMIKTDGGAGWAAVEKFFNQISVSCGGALHRDHFGQCIGMNEEEGEAELALDLFDALTRIHNTSRIWITKRQLRKFWDQICDKTFDFKLVTFIYMMDKDADGRIKEEEVKKIIRLSASANKLSNIDIKAEEYAALIMEELDPDNLGYIMRDSLIKLLLQAPSQLVEGAGRRKLSKMLSMKMKNAQIDNPIRRFFHSTKYFLLDNWQRVWVMALWIGVMAVLFAYKYVQYQHRAAYEVMGHCVCMAKGSAETLKFNMALILLPVCRNTITWLRSNTKLGVAVSFDDNLNFHKVIAIGITIAVGIHVISHLACDFPRLLNASEKKYELMEPFFGKQPKSYWHFVKSVEGITGIFMVVLMAIAFTLATSWFRRNQVNLPRPLKKFTGFNAFWYSHHLFIVVYTLLIVHGYYVYLTHKWYEKTTWMYLAIPICLYGCERLIRALRSSIKPVNILKVAVYPGNVLALHMSKPQGFSYKSGQYMFVNCAAVSPFEWHPFCITSAPGDDYLSVHIRTLGDWTRQLKTVFSQKCEASPSSVLRADSLPGNINIPKVLIDGPYGAPTQDYQNYEVVLLVSLGIGVASMISIVKNIVQNSNSGAMEDGTTTSPARTMSSLDPGPRRIKTMFKTRQAYLYWLNREQKSFDWFQGVMNKVAELDYNNAIELHCYLTSVYEEGDARSALITMLQSLNHAKNGVDIVSGTRVLSHFGKPNWRNVYKRIALRHTNTRVGVFYCGPPVLRKELQQLGLDFSHETTTKFHFHPDQF